jgi:hypothetical protein
MGDEQGFLDDKVEEQNEIAEHIFGMVARRDREPMDETKSLAWQRGWAEAQE